MIGANLSHYRIDAELGRGGMGIVYRAHDTKLNRDVALKVLPAAALASADDRARFFREAQAAAQLTHPNIATIHQIDEAIPLDETGAAMAASDGPRPFIAMELIEGQTLSEEIAKGPFKLDEAVRIAAQVAGALKAAHAKDIVHRDIKSANVMLTPDGIAKVLDFGLAKTNQSTQLTRMGSTLGTVAYMSPEQARGQEVDGRSDLYSLGTMLYEMIAGRLPFAGEYEQAVVYGILNESPEPLTAVRTGVPIGLEWIVTKLLAKEPRHRYQTAADLLADLETVDLSGSGLSRRSMPAATGVMAGSAVRPKTDFRMLAGIAVGVMLATLAVSWLVFSPGSEAPKPTREYQLLLEPATRVSFPVIAPDGSFMVYFSSDSTGTTTWLTRFDGQPPEKLPINVSGFYLHISDDSRYIVASDPMSVYSLETKSTTSLTNQDFRASGIVLTRTAEVLYARQNGPLLAQPIAGGTPREVTTLGPGEDSHTRANLLPDQRHVVYTRFTFPNMDSTALFIADLETGSSKELLDGAHTAKFLASGHLLYYRGNDFNAFVQPFDPDDGEFIGPAQRLSNRFSMSAVSVDQSGTLVLGPREVNQGETTGIYLITAGGSALKAPFLVDERASFLSVGGGYFATRVSFDGRAEIHVYRGSDDDISPDPMLRLPAMGGPFFRLSRDGSVFGYYRYENGESVFVKRDMASGLESVHDFRDVTRNGFGGFDWLDADHIVLDTSVDGVRSGLQVVDLTTNTITRTIQPEDRDYSRPAVSPNGKWVAFSERSQESPRVLVRDIKAERPAVEIGLGDVARWNEDGTRLWVGMPDGIAYYDLGFSEGISRLGSAVYVYRATYRGFEPFGESVAMLGSAGSAAAPQTVTLIENWLDEVRRIAPPE